MQKRKNKRIVKPIIDSIPRNLLNSTIFGIISFILFLAIFSLVLLKTDISSDKFYILVLISSGISVLVGSLAASIYVKKNKLLVGLISTITVNVIEFLILLCFNNAELSVKIYFMFPIGLILGFIGCVIGSNIKAS